MPAQTLYEASAMDKEALTPDENVPEFWKLIDVEPLPEPPPPTPEGDKIALAALDKVHGLFPITDPELGYWIAESEEASIYCLLRDTVLLYRLASIDKNEHSD